MYTYIVASMNFLYLTRGNMTKIPVARFLITGMIQNHDTHEFKGIVIFYRLPA